MEYIAPRPIDSSLLRLQDKHVSNLIWDDEERMIRPRHQYVWNMPPEPVRELIEAAGFGHVLSIADIPINHHLITALVERWRPETHTFHFPYGEATVTLEDVWLQLGLCIDGLAVTGPTNVNYKQLCLDYLGVELQDDSKKGNSVKIMWLESTFSVLPDNATEVVLTRYARAHILRMIGGLLMPDTSGARVHLMYLFLLHDLSNDAQRYSWGAAVLACFYRGLDRAVDPTQHEIGGCKLLLQSWAWDHIPKIAPHMYHIPDDEVLQGLAFPLARRWSRPLTATHTPGHSATLIRYALDRLNINEFIWMPYDEPEIRRLHIPDVPEISRALVLIISYAIVEWHPVDRVMRQFGMRQDIPQAPPNWDALHRVDMRGKADVFWPNRHRDYIQSWNNRHNQIVMADLCDDVLHENSDYMRWYIRHTQRYITRQGAATTGSFSFVQSLRSNAVAADESEHYKEGLHQVIWSCTDMLQALRDIHPPPPFSTQHEEDVGGPTQHSVPNYPPPPETQSYSQAEAPQADTFSGYMPQYNLFHSVPSSSNVFESGPSMFGTTFDTPFSAQHQTPMEDYCPMISFGDASGGNDGHNQDDHGGDDQENEPAPLQRNVRGRGRRRGVQLEDVDQPRRVQPPRNRRRPHCGTSSHH